MERASFLRLIASAAFAPGLEGVAPSSDDDAFARAKKRIARLKGADGPGVLWGAQTNCYDHGRQTPLAVVLLHGFTNNPIQFARLAGELYAQGSNVLVPRLPGHGFADRMSTMLEGLTADDFTAAADAAIDAARGLGRRLAIGGISLGGTLCAWLMTRRRDIDLAVSIAPAIALNKLSHALDELAIDAMTAMPAATYAWWDPHLKEGIRPAHAYPRYPIRTLGEIYRIGEAVIQARGPFPADRCARIVFALNPNDPAVNGTIVTALARTWSACGWIDAKAVQLDGVPQFHDIIEPEAQGARIAAVYPQLIRLILGGATSGSPSS